MKSRKRAELILKNPEIKPYWVCLPIHLRNAVSQFQPHWLCWDENKKDATKMYWEDCNDEKSQKIVGNVIEYINQLESDTDFGEFANLEFVKETITSGKGKKALIDKEDVKRIA